MSALSLEELKTRRAQLEAARYSGTKVVVYAWEGGQVRTEYASDGEMKSALADLDRQIAAASGVTPIRTVRLSTSKGV
jgi:hypothetical protein